MPAQYFPTNDEALRAWMESFISKLADIMTDLSLPATFDDAIIAANAAFVADLDTHNDAQVAAQSARAAKDASKSSLIAILREIVRQLRANPEFTNEMAQLLQLPEYDTTPTPKLPGLEVPTIEVDINAIQHHKLRFWQQAPVGTETVPRPNWARAARIVRAVVASGQPCPPLEDMEFLASDTSSPYSYDLTGADVGKDVWYRAAWETPRGDLGTFSDPAKGTVRG